MSLRNILVFLDAATPSEGRLRLATRIAHDHQACLSAAFLQNGKAPGAPHEVAAPWLGLLAGPPIDGSVHTTQSATLAEMAEQDFRDRLGSRQLQGDWHALERPETSVLIALARAADLIIIGQID